ncbi:hypothetical protein FP803_01115, partial [Candidatus Woesearchaeota archaeon]|nr:hypothetical protein [Candidatus Woesearchaeota archaeon]
MKKGKTISMVLIIVMIVLLAGGIVRSVDIVTKEEMSNEEVEKSTQANTEDLYIIKDAANNEFSTEIKPPMAPAKIPVVEEAKQQVLAFSSEQQRDNFIKELNIIKVFNNQIRVEDNKVIYTAWNQDEKDVSLAETYNAVIIFDEKGAIESKTYTKKYSEELTRKTIIKPKELTEKSWINDLLDYIIIDSNANGEIDNGDKKIDISKAQMGITDVSYEYEKGVYSATLKDGSKGELKEIGEEKKLLRFVYETEENVVHTLQSLDGGGTLEFYDKNTEEGDKGTGTITIIRGSEKIKFYGTFDEDGMIVKDGKTILAKLDNGNILTDYKGGEPQTIYYAKDTFGYKEYAFGRIQ